MNIIKTYILNKVKTIIEDFIETTIWQVDRLFISAIKEEYLWSVTSINGHLSRIGFRFMEPNKLMFYEFNHWGEEINCFVWEFPNIIVDAPSHPMSASSLMRELWRHIHRIMMNANIQSEYKSFIATVKRGEQYKYLNAQYGLTAIPIPEEVKRVVTAAALKAARDSLLMPMCPSWDRYPGQEDDINCILNGPTKGYNKEEKIMIIPEIKNVFFNEVKKTTTVVFNDHTSIIVKCTDKDEFDPEMGLAMALVRKCFGSRSKFQKAVAKWVKTSEPKNEQLRKKAARKAEREAAKIEHAKAQAESYME